MIKPRVIVKAGKLNVRNKVDSKVTDKVMFIADAMKAQRKSSIKKKNK